LSGSVSGTTVYGEMHTGKTTNAFGLVNFEIGIGSLVSGTFSAISWGTNPYFIKVEMDPNPVVGFIVGFVTSGYHFSSTASPVVLIFKLH
jgi:hypothetical protein